MGNLRKMQVNLEVLAKKKNNKWLPCKIACFLSLKYLISRGMVVSRRGKEVPITRGKMDDIATKTPPNSQILHSNKADLLSY